jgi:hypothetical protein
LNKKAENSKSFVKFKWKSKALHQIKQPHEAAEIPLTKSSDRVTPSSFKEQVVNMDQLPMLTLDHTMGTQKRETLPVVCGGTTTICNFQMTTCD